MNWHFGEFETGLVHLFLRGRKTFSTSIYTLSLETILDCTPSLEGLLV
jgi:hypothetical protein